MNPQEDTIIPVPENDFLEAARAIDTGHPPRSENSLSSIANSVRDVVSEYPGPAILISAGLAWMLLRREQKHSRSLPTRIKESALHGKDQLVDAVHQAKDQVHDAQQSLLERAREAKEEAMHGFESGRQKATNKAELSKLQAIQKLDEAKAAAEEKAEAARDAYQHVLEDNPLILGACAMIAGLAIGLLIPSTQREDEMMGAQRDSLLDQARAIVDNARQAAVSTLRGGSENIKTHLSEATEAAKETLSESLQSAKRAVTTEASDTDLAP